MRPLTSPSEIFASSVRGASAAPDGMANPQQSRHSRIRFIGSPRLCDQIIEIDYRISLGPDAVLPGAGKCLIMRVDHLAPIEGHAEMIAVRIDRELMPDAAGNLAVPAGELHAPEIGR